MRNKPYRISCFKPELPADYVILDGYREIQKTGIVSNFGPITQRFEKIAQDYLYNDHVMAVSSCDTGLNLAIKAMQLPPNSYIAVPSFTFTSTVNAIEWNGHHPVFVDIDPNTFNISPDSLREALNNYKGNIEAILATHIFGNPCDVQALNNFDLPIIFDAAHAYGSKWNGYKVGTYAATSHSNVFAQVYSFSGTKLVTCGEGGLISTTEETAERIKYLRGYGFYGDYNCIDNGLNGKISEFNALIGTHTLPTIDTAVMRRNQLIEAYKKRLGGNFKFQHVKEYNTSTYKDLAIICDSKEQRDRIYNKMEEVDIQTKKYFFPMHMTDNHKHEHGWVKLENTNWVYDRILCLPLYNSITQQEMDEVVMTIGSVL